MTQTATLYRFQIELSDIMRGVYQTLEFRTAQHPSESADYLLTRVIAFALNFQDGLEFAPQGLNDPDAPALRILNTHGTAELWIEIGNPSARKLHKASKVAKEVKVYTYKDPEHLLRELAATHVHRKEELKIYSIKPLALLPLEQKLERANRWAMVFNDGLLSVTTDQTTFELEINQH